MSTDVTPPKKSILTIFIMSIIVIAVVAISIYWMKNRPRATRTPTKVLAPLVTAVKTDAISHNIKISALGKVTPVQIVELSSQVSGEVIDVRDELIPGIELKKGDLIAQINPIDFELLLRQKEADLVKAEFELELEVGKVAVAKREYELLGEDISKENRSLILREPHLKAAKAKVDSAKANVALAKLNLHRTKIVSPFNATVKTRFVSVGMQIRSGSKIVTLVGSERYWIEATLPSNALKWINFDKNASKVDIKQNHHGVVKTIMSDVEQNGRMARVVIEVVNPLNNYHGSPLLLDDIVNLSIHGKTLNNVIKIPRFTLHNGNNIWFLSPNDKLKILKIMPIWTEKDAIYILADTISKEYKLITSSIPAPVSGMSLRTK